MTSAANALANPIVGGSLAAARKNFSLRAAIAVYLAAGCISVLAYFVVGGQFAAAPFVATSGLAFAALLLAPKVHGPASTLPWRWLAAGMGAFLLGNAARLAVRAGGATELSWLADIGYIGYLFLAIGLMAFIRVRRPRYRLARLIDGLAVGCAAALAISLASLEDPAAAGLNAYGAVGLIVTPTFEALLLGGTAYLVFAGGGLRARAQQLVLIGISAMAGADLLYSLHLGSSGPLHSLMDLLWMTSYLLLGASAIVPSMRSLTEPQAEDAAQRGAARAMLGLVGAVAVLFVFDVLGKLTTGTSGIWFEVAEAALIVLVLVRARQAALLDSARERRVAVLLAHAADALTVVGSDGKIKLGNPAAARILGISESSVGRPIFDYFDRVHPDQRAPLRERLTQVLGTPGATDNAIVRLEGADGTYRSLEVAVANRAADPAVGGVVLNFHDVTDRVRATAELNRLGTAIEQASEAVIITNAAAEIEYVNPAFERLTGYSRAEVLGQNPRFLKSGEQKPSFYDALWKTLAAGQPWRADFVNRRKDGTQYRMAGVITPLRGEAGEVTGYVGVSRDLTHQRELESAARNLARERALIADTIRGIDPREAPEKLAQAVCGQLATLNDVALAGLFVYDADGRSVPYGFVVASGEQAPRRRVPRARTTYLRERTAAGPWIEAWIERPAHPYNELILRKGVKALAYAPVRDNDRAIGFIVIGSAAPNAEEHLASMLSVVVETGVIAGKLIAVKVAERSELSAERRRITEIIDSRAFFPVYQPLRDALTEIIVGYEALTRFDDGMAPDLRFAEAHEVGLGEKLELAAAQAAIDGAAAIPHDIWLNINASPAVVLDGGELGRLINQADRDIVLEVTEHSEITDYDAFRRAIHELGPKVRVAVDDAGAGFASMRHIIELRPAFVKLDRQVIAGIDHDEARQAMVAGLGHFAINTGCWLIAEGVETAEEMHALRKLDVRYVQGYLLGRPAPAYEFDGVGRPAAPSGGAASTGLAAPRTRRR